MQRVPVQPLLPLCHDDGEGEGSERSDRRRLYQDGDQFEKGLGHALQQRQDRVGASADDGHRNAEQDGEEQRLQDLAAGESTDHGLGDDVHQEADDGGVVGPGCVLGHGRRIEGGGIDVHPGTQPHHIGDDRADDQGQGREGQELCKGLADHLAEPPEAPQVGEAGRHRQ